MKKSCGTLLYKGIGENLRVLVVHPSGNSRWSIPKGEPEAGETQEETARRETWEETGLFAEDLELLGEIIYATRKKKVICFHGRISESTKPFINSPEEIDRVEWMTLEQARVVLHRDQARFIKMFEEKIYDLQKIESC